MYEDLKKVLTRQITQSFKDKKKSLLNDMIDQSHKETIMEENNPYSLYEGFSLFLSRDLPSIYVLDRNGSLHLMSSRIATAGFNQPEDITAWL